MKSIRNDFVSYLQQRFPTGFQFNNLESLVSENLLSPFVIQLPTRVVSQAQDFAKALYSLRQSASYLSHMAPSLSAKGLKDPGNKSILMSYDFHLDQNDQLKLIEVNTNASFLALGDAMYAAHKIKQPIADFTMDEIRDNILEELDLFGRPNPRPEVAIVDESPETQKLYIEFLLYKQWMDEWGFQSSIKDVSEITGTEDFIYNRSTDFYFENDSSKKLRTFFHDKDLCVSPNPHEYFLLADKQRLSEWPLLTTDPAILQCIPKSFLLNSTTAEAAWASRKQLFFKPMRSFGAKQSFRGGSISRKIFEDLVNAEVLAQEFIPAPEKSFDTPMGKQSFKYDLRFFAYKDRIQSVVARLYQGQVTNLRTPLGGFSPICFV